MEVHRSATEPWRVTLVDTGERTMTGGRLKRVLPYSSDEEFCFTYGDGARRHRHLGADRRSIASTGTLATVTAVQPPGRFGALELDGERVRGFEEKPRGDGGWTNGGFFVLSPEVGRYLDGDETVWEQEPMRSLASDGQLACLPPRRLLAGDGHAARPQPARGAVGARRGAVADVGVAMPHGRHGATGALRRARAHRSRLLAGQARAAHRPHRLQGSLDGAVAADARRRASRLLARRAHGAVAVRARAGRRGHARASRATCATTSAVAGAVRAARPEIVIHMAAQSLVRRSFAAPRETYETNVMGTVNVLDAVRVDADGVRVLVNVTSDKCYENREWEWGYREDEPMGGNDPYSSSKGCAELVTSAFRRSFFSDPDAHARGLRARRQRDRRRRLGRGPPACRTSCAPRSTASAARVRNPDSIRPWQHVLNPLSGYLVLAQALWDSPEHAGGWNFGPPRATTRARSAGSSSASPSCGPSELRWEHDDGPAPARGALPEARLLARARAAGLAAAVGPRRGRSRRPSTGTARSRDGADMRAVHARRRSRRSSTLPRRHEQDSACRFCGAPLERCSSTSAPRRSPTPTCRRSRSTRWSRSIRCARSSAAAASSCSSRSSRRPSGSSPTTRTSRRTRRPGSSTAGATPSR